MTNGIYPFEEILAELNWSKKDLADYLSLSRSHLSLIIQGKREVAVQVGFRLSQLALLVYNSKDDPNYIASRIKSDQRELKKSLAFRNKNCLQEVARLESRLKEMEDMHAKVLESLKRLAIMDVNSVKIELNEKLVLGHMMDYWEYQLAKCSIADQHALRLRIHTLHQEIAFNTTASAKW
jgi:DNA-binding Xre family transcriptional regulator